MGIYRLRKYLLDRVPEVEVPLTQWPSGTTFLVDAQNVLQSDLRHVKMLEQLARAGFVVVVVFDGSINNVAKVHRRVERLKWKGAAALKKAAAASAEGAEGAAAGVAGVEGAEGAAGAAASAEGAAAGAVTEDSHLATTVTAETASTTETAATPALALNVDACVYKASLAWGRYMRMLHIRDHLSVEVVLPEDNGNSSADAYIANWVYTHPDRECCILSHDTDLLFIAKPLPDGSADPVHVAPIAQLTLEGDQVFTRSRTLRQLLSSDNQHAQLHFGSICAAWLLGRCLSLSVAQKKVNDPFDRYRLANGIERVKTWGAHIDEVADMVREFPDGMYATHLLPLLSENQRMQALQPRSAHWFRNMVLREEIEQRFVPVKGTGKLSMKVREVAEMMRRCVAMDLARVGVTHFPGDREKHGVTLLLDNDAHIQMSIPASLLAQAAEVLAAHGEGFYDKMLGREQVLARTTGLRGESWQLQVAMSQVVGRKTRQERLHDILRLLWVINPALYNAEGAEMVLQRLEAASAASCREGGSDVPDEGPNLVMAYIPMACVMVLMELLSLEPTASESSSTPTITADTRLSLVMLACHSAKIDVSCWFWSCLDT